MQNYILRIEAVNLSVFIEDTQDLNTIRGGGLLLLDAAKAVEKKFKHDLRSISTGASTGIFRFSADDQQGAEKLREDVANYLVAPEAKFAGLSHATFVVIYEKDDPDVANTFESLLARSRWRQFQQVTMVLPGYGSGSKVCELDALRPAQVEIAHKDKTQWFSKSVHSRRQYGKMKKNKFYADLLGKEKKSGQLFARHFEELAHAPDKGDLHRKMAVVYFDGNGFGNIRKELCKTWEDQESFDKDLRQYQKEMLKALLDKVEGDTDWRTKEEVIRLETLLWGGDELIWVVPAWKGWETVKLFFKKSASWKLKGRQDPLTHAGGIVFCHHNAPVHGIVKVAKSLADSAKKNAKKCAPYANMFQYLILESFDTIGSSLSAYREAYTPFPVSYDLSWESNGGTVSADSLETLRQSLLASDISKRQLYKGVRAAMDDHAESNPGDTMPGNKKYTAFLKRLVSLAGLAPDAGLKNGVPIIGGVELSPQHLYHIIQLWDYLPEEGRS